MDWSVDTNWKKSSLSKQKQFKKVLDRLKPNTTIKILPQLHEEVFEEINCLDCANCCKNHSPTFKATDIKRISKHLKIKETDLIENYLFLDQDNDWVLKSSPCVFLNSDNTCLIYDVRPSDCARYPYTNEDVFIKRKSLTIKNSVVCPAVFKVLERLEKL